MFKKSIIALIYHCHKFLKRSEYYSEAMKRYVLIYVHEKAIFYFYLITSVLLSDIFTDVSTWFNQITK
jgi:hypothetical protein